MRVGEVKWIDPTGLFVLALSLIGAITVAIWIVEVIPKSIEAYLNLFNQWFMTTMFSLMDIITGSIIVINLIFIIAVLAGARANPP